MRTLLYAFVPATPMFVKTFCPPCNPNQRHMLTVLNDPAPARGIFEHLASLRLVLFETQKEISRDLVAEPAACHARSDLEQVRNDAFVQSSDTLFPDDDPDCIPDGLVLVAKARHRVDLESTPQHVERICDCLCHGSRNRSSSKTTHDCWVLVPSGVRYLRTDSYVMKFKPTCEER